MATTVFRNVKVWDSSRAEPEDGEVRIEDDRIVEVSDRPIKAADANEVDGRGGVLMPGLIDAHCHVMLSHVNPQRLEEVPPTLMAAMAARSMRETLMRGFTTIRDCGGADFGLVAAVEQGYFPGPRIFASGRPLSQTGGHGDFRRRTAGAVEPCACGSAVGFATQIADGVTEVRKGAREELRRGASQIKVMVSGGVASPSDPIDNRQYSAEELRAIVEEAESWNTYVAAHSYTVRSTTHAVECGVRTIEHGNLIDEATARLMAERTTRSSSRPWSPTTRSSGAARTSAFSRSASRSSRRCGEPGCGPSSTAGRRERRSGSAPICWASCATNSRGALCSRPRRRPATRC